MPDLRAMTLKALLQAGGVDYLARQAESNPMGFMGLLGRVMPREVHTELTAEVRVKQEVRRDLIDRVIATLQEEWAKRKVIEHEPQLMLEAQAANERDGLTARQTMNRKEGIGIVAGAAQRAAAMHSDAHIASVDSGSQSNPEDSGSASGEARPVTRARGASQQSLGI